MTVPVYSSLRQWYSEGREASYVRAQKSPGGILDLIEVARPAGEMPRPALPDLVLIQDQFGGSSVCGDSGRGHFNVRSAKGSLYLAAPDFEHTIALDTPHQIRALSFPLAQWETVLDEACDGNFSADSLQLYRGSFDSPAIQSSLRNLLALSDEERAPSRLLARAPCCEILAELCRLSGASFTPANGDLAPWVGRRCRELMRARLSEDITLDELAAEAQLSPFHFVRMFKQGEKNILAKEDNRNPQMHQTKNGN